MNGVSFKKGIVFHSDLAEVQKYFSRNEDERKTSKAKHTYHDLGLIMQERRIGMPEIFSFTVEIPGRDGLLDLTEKYYEKPTYKNRKNGASFANGNGEKDWANIISTVADNLHGRMFYYVFDDDESWYYHGRFMTDPFETNRAKVTVSVDIDSEPYKMELFPQADIYKDASGKYQNAWLWDPFDFRDGIINPNVWENISGEIEITITNRHKRVQPYFKSTGTVIITFENKEYKLNSTHDSTTNSYKWKAIDGLWFDEGKNTFKAKAESGTVEMLRCRVIGGKL